MVSSSLVDLGLLLDVVDLDGQAGEDVEQEVC